MSTSICEKEATRLEIPNWILGILFSKAQAASPCEACGYLVAKMGTVYLVREFWNDARLPEQGFQLPGSILLHARIMYGDDIALWHSHPTSAALPSQADRVLIRGTNVPHLIVSVYPRPQAILYRLKGNRVVQAGIYEG